MLCTRVPYRSRIASKSSQSRSMIATGFREASRRSNARMARSFVSLGLLTWLPVCISETLVRWSVWYMLALIAATRPPRSHHLLAVSALPWSGAEAFMRRRSKCFGSTRSTRMIESPRSLGWGDGNSPSSSPGSRTRQGSASLAVSAAPIGTAARAARHRIPKSPGTRSDTSACATGARRPRIASGTSRLHRQDRRRREAQEDHGEHHDGRQGMVVEADPHQDRRAQGAPRRRKAERARRIRRQDEVLHAAEHRHDAEGCAPGLLDVHDAGAHPHPLDGVPPHGGLDRPERQGPVAAPELPEEMQHAAESETGGAGDEEASGA